MDTSFEENKATEDISNVFVKYLPSDVDDSALRTLFTSYGKILSAKVMVDTQTLHSLGYGFVMFSSPDEAQNAVKAMGGHRIQNKSLLCKISESFSPSANLYIKPLPSRYTEDELNKMFEPYGEVTAAKIVRDPAKSDVIGLVRFEHMESATKAIQALHGCTLASGWPPVIVKYAESDAQRAKRKASITPPPKRKHSFSSSPPTSPVSPMASPMASSPLFVPFSCYYDQTQYIPVTTYVQTLPYGWFNSHTNMLYPSYCK